METPTEHSEEDIEGTWHAHPAPEDEPEDDKYFLREAGIALFFLVLGAALATGYIHFTEYYSPVCDFLNTCAPQPAPQIAAPNARTKDYDSCVAHLLYEGESKYIDLCAIYELSAPQPTSRDFRFDSQFYSDQQLCDQFGVCHKGLVPTKYYPAPQVNRWSCKAVDGNRFIGTLHYKGTINYYTDGWFEFTGNDSTTVTTTLNQTPASLGYSDCQLQ